MGIAADGGVVAVKVNGAAVEELVKFSGTEHLHVLVGCALAASVAVFDDGVTLRLHHLGKTQGLASEGAMAIGLRVLRVKNADEM